MTKRYLSTSALEGLLMKNNDITRLRNLLVELRSFNAYSLQFLFSTLLLSMFAPTFPQNISYESALLHSSTLISDNFISAAFFSLDYRYFKQFFLIEMSFYKCCRDTTFRKAGKRQFQGRHII